MLIQKVISFFFYLLINYFFSQDDKPIEESEKVKFKTPEKFFKPQNEETDEFELDRENSGMLNSNIHHLKNLLILKEMRKVLKNPRKLSEEKDDLDSDSKKAADSKPSSPERENEIDN